MRYQFPLFRILTFTSAMSDAEVTPASTPLTPSEPTRRNWLSFGSLATMTGLNAFNDNFARFMLLPLGGWLVAQGARFGIEHILGILMVLPFILFAPTSGWLADRFAKSTVVRWSAWVQLAVLSLMAFALWQRSLLLALVAFFLLAVQSALLSPSKTGILKELLGRRRLALGSGIMDGSTILTVLAGQILAGLVFDSGLAQSGDGWTSALGPLLILTAGAFVAIALSYFIERTPRHEVGPLTPGVAFRHVRDFKSVWGDREVRLCALGVAFFYAFATFIILAVYEVASDLYQGGEGTGTANSWMMATASVGIAAGSVAAGYLSRKGTELGLVPLGGLVMTLGSVMLALTPAGGGFFKFALFVAGAGAAVFLVPLKAHLLDISPSEERGKVLSVSNLMNNVGGMLVIALQFGFQALELPIGWQMGSFALLAAWATLSVTRLLPQDFFRFIGLTLIRSLYRIRVRHADRMPAEGGAILCPNHLSFVDALVIYAASPRRVRFLIAEKCFRRKWVGDFARLFNAVPVSPERAKEAIRIAADEVVAGNVVCIFPEGQLSRCGGMLEVKRGFEMIARKSKCPVIPCYMHGLWGTFTSFSGGRYFKKKPRRLGSGLIVSFGEPVAPREVNVAVMESAWRELASQSLDLEAIDQSDFADAGTLLGSEPAEWKAAVRQLAGMKRDGFKALARQARELNSVAFWQRHERILLEWQPGDSLSQVLALLLPPLVGVKVVLVAKGAPDTEILRVVCEEKVDRIVLQSGGREAGFISALIQQGCIVQLLETWSGGEDLLSLPGVYPSLVEDGRIVSWSMPHPDEDALMATFQKGWKEGTAGRLLPASGAPAGWHSDAERFLVRAEAGSAG